MPPFWAELLQNGDALQELYDQIPLLESVTLRSIHLDRYGPTVTLRIDLPEFPQKAPSEWREDGFTTFQCQLQFLAVADLLLTEWNPPVVAEVRISSLAGRRISVQVVCVGEGGDVDFSFSSSDSLLVGHLSVFEKTGDGGGSDAGRHCFLGRLDARLFGSMPGVDEKTFYEHI